MMPAPPLLLRIWMSTLLMIVANGCAAAAGWVTPEIGVADPLHSAADE